MIEHFSAPEVGFYDTSDDHEMLVVRTRDLQDNAVPSGNAMAILIGDYPYLVNPPDLAVSNGHPAPYVGEAIRL